MFVKGAATFPGLRKFIAEKSKTRVLSFLHIAAHGLASAGCTASGMLPFEWGKKLIRENVSTHGVQCRSATAKIV